MIALSGVLACLRWLAAWHVAGHLPAALAWADSPQRAMLVMTGLTVAVLAVAVVGCLASGAAVAGDLASLPVTRRVAALREKSWRVAFLRVRDPDARGRTRPRAPSPAPAAA
ncbi:MAG: hypothetical protein J2P25_14725 [Nocardiopsaceae bacterium]|nr:hypothetical protein [Nocardiopsaceae bacterium]